MKEAQAVDTGVTGQAEAPQAEEASPATEQHDEGQTDNGVDRALSPAQARIQKLANENRQYRERVQRYEQEVNGLSGARQLHELLQRDPQKARAVMDLLEGRLAIQQQEQKDPFAEYQPHEAEALRAALEAKNWMRQQQEYQQQQYQQSIQENNETLMTTFEENLKKDGLVDKNGNYDEPAVKTIAAAVMAQAIDIAKDPNRITQKEMNQAYQATMSGLKSLEKRALKATVRTSPPPSNTHRGTIPVGRTKETDEQRILRITKEFEQARG